MEERANYTLIGLFVVLMGAALAGAALWLSVGIDVTVYHTYAVSMDEAVSGLSEQAPVKYNGVQVGYVKRITLNKKNPQKVILLLSIKKNTPITTSTSASLESQGITGITYIGLRAKSANGEMITKKPGEKYPEIPYAPSFLVRLNEALRDVLEDFRLISKAVTELLSEKNVNSVTQSLADFSAFTGMLKDKSIAIGHTIDNADKILKNVESASTQFPALISEIRQSTNEIKLMGKDVAKAGRAMSKTMDSGRRAVDNISQQAVPSAVSLLQKLNNVAGNLEQISAEMRKNPSMLLRGKAPGRPGPGEH